jgi:hypothetical protein
MEYILVCPLTLVNFVGSLVLLFSKQKLYRATPPSRICAVGHSNLGVGGGAPETKVVAEGRGATASPIGGLILTVVAPPPT